jgi:Ca-activated chloride channel family protein
MYELEYPWLLLLMILPLAIYWGLPTVPVEYKMALRVPFFAKNSVLKSQMMKTQTCLWFWHWLGIWALLSIALAGPRWVGSPQMLSEESRNMMLVLDISGSMGLRDMPNGRALTSRWSVVKHTALSFVAKRSEDKIGLILFGERAYLFAPLTHDHLTLTQRIDDASIGLAGQATALGDAMTLAIKHLESTPLKGRVMILLTDGVANAGVISPLKAAQYAKDQAIKIYAIGLGPQPNQKSLSGLFWQMQHVNDLDEKSLQKIASMTHGQYYRATDAQSLNTIYQAIARLEPVVQARNHVRPEKSYFYVPLAIALLWIIFLFGWQTLIDRRKS